jgi:hypothetical protein
VIYNLNNPLSSGQDTISSLTLREPRVCEVINAQKDGKDNEMQMMLSLVAAVSGVNLKIVEKLSMSDFIAASDHVASFLSSRQPSSE